MSRDVRSAPELPHEVAKQYGLHNERLHKPDSSALAPAPVEEDRTPVSDPKTEAAVDDIVAKESDALLAIDDGTHVESSVPVKRGFRHKIGHFFAAWWRNKWARGITIVALTAVVATVASVPSLRYGALNTVGVRSSASVIVLDNTTQLPLKNVAFTIDDKQTRTDINGVARLSRLKLGKHIMAIKRVAFAPYSRQVTIGWGSNPLGKYQLQAVGTQYTILVTDFLSGKPIEGAEAESEQANALADASGKIILTVDDIDVTKLDVTIRANGYRSEPISLDATLKTSTTVPLVSDKKDIFVSKQSGKYDIYSVDLDGKNKKLVLAGTGSETSNMSLVTSPDNTQAALVSTRENVRDRDGYLLQTLTFINLATGVSTVVDRAQQIQPVNWVGNRFVYRSTIAAASASDAGRNRLISYNFETNTRLQLATANQFNSILSASGRLYYAASSTDARATLGMFRVKPDGSSRERLSDQEVWTALRSSYNILSLQTPDGWYTLAIDSKQLTKSTTPALNSYFFAESPKGDSAIWTDTRDGKGTLLLQNIHDGQNKVLTAQTGLTNPVRWLGDKAIVYRVVSSGEAADYVISPDGGVPHKVTDVTPAAGFVQVQ